MCPTGIVMWPKLGQMPILVFVSSNSGSWIDCRWFRHFAYNCCGISRSAVGSSCGFDNQASLSNNGTLGALAVTLLVQ